jgi:hypothetical protein
MSLNHQIIYRKDLQKIDDEWKNVSYNPLAIYGEKINPLDYIEIHDDLLRYFSDMFYWINMYNPAKKELNNGFCHYGVTAIKGKDIDTFRKIIIAIINLFKYSPKNITLTGNFCLTNDNNGNYEKIKITKEELVEKLTGIKNLANNAIKNNGYILHCGI